MRKGKACTHNNCCCFQIEQLLLNGMLFSFCIIYMFCCTTCKKVLILSLTRDKLHSQNSGKLCFMQILCSMCNLFCVLPNNFASVCQRTPLKNGEKYLSLISGWWWGVGGGGKTLTTHFLDLRGKKVSRQLVCYVRLV